MESKWLAQGGAIAQFGTMFRAILILPLLVTGLPAAAAPPPLTPAEAGRVKCVATLAIVASEQERGTSEWDDLPPLGERGGRFAQIVAGELQKAGRSESEAKASVVSAIEAMQREAGSAADPDTTVREAATDCVAMLDKAVPPPKPPTPLQCAAAVGLAYEEVKGREGMSKTAKDLDIVASVLDNRARDELRAEGKTEAEADIAIGTEKERLLAEYKAAPEGSRQTEIDFPACFAMAQPSPKAGH